MDTFDAGRRRPVASISLAGMLSATPSFGSALRSTSSIAWTNTSWRRSSMVFLVFVPSREGSPTQSVGLGVSARSRRCHIGRGAPMAVVVPPRRSGTSKSRVCQNPGRLFHTHAPEMHAHARFLRMLAPVPIRAPSLASFVVHIDR